MPAGSMSSMIGTMAVRKMTGRSMSSAPPAWSAMRAPAFRSARTRRDQMIRSIEDFIKAVHDDSSSWLPKEPKWFRGERQGPTPLLPSLYRKRLAAYENLTRPLGATVGDLLDKPLDDGGLASSRNYPSTI